jgi:membrane associated rhomboid family serine protease
MFCMKLCRADLSILFVLAVVPVLCVVVFYLPLSIQYSLAAKGETLDPFRYITSGFVHGNLLHLLNNLLGFLLFGLLVFGLNKVAGSQKFLFYCLMWVIFLVPLLNGLVVFAFSDSIFKGALSGYSIGLSLIAGGVMGLVVPSILSLLHVELENKVFRGALFLGLLMLSGSFIIFVYLGSSLFWRIFFGTLTVVGVLLVCLSFSIVIRNVRRGFNQWIFMKLSLVIFALLLYFSLMPWLFPAQIVIPNLGVVNIFAHYFGVSFGMLPGFYLVLHTTKSISTNNK